MPPDPKILLLPKGASGTIDLFPRVGWTSDPLQASPWSARQVRGSYDSEVSTDDRYPVPHVSKEKALKDRKVEVELGFDLGAYQEAERCLNCDVQTVFTTSKCIE